MNLQGRNLSVDTHGEDVRLLQSELRQLGFDISDEEVQQAFFGAGTHEAVVGFQETNRLEPTGVVATGTAALINARVETRRPMVGRRQVRQPDAYESVPAAFIKLRPHFGLRMSAGLRYRVKQAGDELDQQSAHAVLWFRSFAGETEPPFMTARQPGEVR
jgi:peptidoglycan hydrolase-like protein with peptidoglycan-binding domain